MIPFNVPPSTGNEQQYVLSAMGSDIMSGHGPFNLYCQRWFEKNLPCRRALLTPSCTAALELAAILIDIEKDNEIIMPSFTFSSTANAFALRGARIVFVDIEPDTMNLNAKLIEPAITKNTKAIVPVHYAGVACDMEAIMEIAKKYGLFVIEDAAQGMMSDYKGQALGTIGHLGAFSFHETKNYTSGGEGGLLLINDERFIERAEIIREKGTNRSKFHRGQIDKYQWVDIGSSFLLSELQSAYLYGQLEEAEKIKCDRLASWNHYFTELLPLVDKGKIDCPKLQSKTSHNAHIFFLKTKNVEERTNFINYMKQKGILATFHYVPLHSSKAGQKFSMFHGQDRFTTIESERLVRLPLWYGMSKDDRCQVIDAVKGFFC